MHFILTIKLRNLCYMAYVRIVFPLIYPLNQDTSDYYHVTVVSVLYVLTMYLVTQSTSIASTTGCSH